MPSFFIECLSRSSIISLCSNGPLLASCWSVTQPCTRCYLARDTDGCDASQAYALLVHSVATATGRTYSSLFRSSCDLRTSIRLACSLTGASQAQNRRGMGQKYLSGSHDFSVCVITTVLSSRTKSPLTIDVCHSACGMHCQGQTIRHVTMCTIRRMRCAMSACSFLRTFMTFLIWL